MSQENFKLNEKWKENSRTYQSKRIEACQYQKGMETGFKVYYFNKLNSKNQGIKVFVTEEEAWNFIRQDAPQYIVILGKKIEIRTIDYHPPAPILHYPLSDSATRNGTDFDIEEEQAFLSDESKMYDILELMEDIWIIRDDNGKVYTWQERIDNSTIFGERSDSLTRISKERKKESENYQLYATSYSKKVFLVATIYDLEIAKEIINTSSIVSYDLELYLNDTLVYSITREY